MAKQRPIPVKIWKEGYFQNFTPEEKLTYLYLFTNEYATESGIYKITLKTIYDDTGIKNEEIEQSFTGSFKNHVVYDTENSVIFVKDFLRVNGVGNPRNVIQSILNDYSDTEYSIVWDEFWLYHQKRIENYIKLSPILQNAIRMNRVSFPELISSKSKIIHQLTNSNLCVVK